MTEYPESQYAIQIVGAEEFVVNKEKGINKVSTPLKAINKKIGYVTEDRKASGIFGQMNVRENITISVLKRLSKLGLISTSKEQEMLEYYRGKMNMKYAGYFQAINSLSGEDKRSANIAIAKALVRALERALASGPDAAAEVAAAKAAANSAGALDQADPRDRTLEETERVMAAARAQAAEQAEEAPLHSRFTIVKNPPRLADIDHTLALAREEYQEALKREQKRFAELELKMYLARVPLMVLYEGDDAAGKGGNIKRVAQAIDPRAYTIFPSPAPTKVELAHPHLWRYWTRLPRAGHVGIYDRSWYGRVLVERVEGFASPAEWSRAYDEINEFEGELEAWGALLLKFWVAVSPEEQLNRFNDRQNNPDKQWKITPEDWRNRDKHPQYDAAVDDMFRLTSTPYAPWRILESTNKYYARVKALKIINDELEKRLGL